MILRGKRIVFVFILGTLILINVQLSHAGWTEIEKDGSMTILSGNKVMRTGKDEWFMADLKSGKFSMGNQKQHIFTTGTMDEYCQAIEAIQTEMMKRMPPEQRQMMEQLKNMNPKDMPQLKTSVVKKGGGGKIAGLDTVRYEVLVNGNPYSKVWVAVGGSLEKRIIKLREKVFSSIRKMGQCIAKGMSMGAPMMASPENSPEYQKIVEQGWVLREIKEGETETDVVQIKKGPIPDSEFHPPLGFKKVSIQEFFRSEFHEE